MNGNGSGRGNNLWYNPSMSGGTHKTKQNLTQDKRSSLQGSEDGT
jgi:hypothetical protein